MRSERETVPDWVRLSRGLEETTFAASGWVTLPKRWRAPFQQTVMVVPALHPFGHLWLYPLETWDVVMRTYMALRDTLPKELDRGLMCATMGRFEMQSLDRNGRFYVPKALRHFSGRATMRVEWEFIEFGPSGDGVGRQS